VIKRRLSYLWTPQLAERNGGVLCPEVPARCQVLEPTQVFGAETEVKAVDFLGRPKEILYPVHNEEYVEFVRTAAARRVRALDSGDTRVTENIFEQALLAASAGPQAVDLVMKSQADTAFCAVRPPGHHANRMRALGFCVFNNVAVAAAYAQKQYFLSRVLILDWDVHPGNGTQEIFWEDPSVFVLSFHEKGQFAQSGSAEHVGGGAGEGFNRNVEFDPKTSQKDYRERFAFVVDEVFDIFKPEFVIISAGFDAHSRDPAASQTLEEVDYVAMTEIVLSHADKHCQGRCVSILEGGYNVPVMRDCVAAHCLALMGKSL
jgi:acetoin utilization deacetylase AcuC-like enzyme